MLPTNVLKLVVCIVSISLPIQAELSPINLKGMATCMQPGYEQLAPAIGALFWESLLIRNLYKFGADSQGMVQLTKNLFSFNIDGITFDITSSYLKIGRYLAPEDIGTIIGAIHYYSNVGKTEKDLEVLKNKIYNVIRLRAEKDKAAIKQAIITGFQATIDRQKNQIIALAQEMKTGEGTNTPEWVFLDTLVAGPFPTKELISRMVNLLQTPLEVSLATNLRQMIKLCQQLASNHSELIDEQHKKPIDNRFFRTNAGTSELKNRDGSVDFSLFKAIVEAVQEERKGLYPQGLTIAILLAWLWKHVAEPSELKVYLESLETSLNMPGKVFIWPNPLEQFTQSDYEQLKAKTEAEIQGLTLDQYLFAFEGYGLYENPLPPEVQMTYIAYRAHSGKWYTGVPDCGETSLRNVLDAFFFDSKTRQFDIPLIKSITTNQALIDFYIKYNTAEKINTIQAHNDWAIVVSELPGVQYHRDNAVEMCAGIRNMLTVLSQLIPGVNTLDALAQKLAKSGIELKWRSDAPIEGYDTSNLIEFAISRPGSDKFQIKWKFLRAHFEVFFPPVFLAPYMSVYKTAIRGTLGKINNSSILVYETLYVLYGAQKKEITQTIAELPKEMTNLGIPFFMSPMNMGALFALTELLVAHLATSSDQLSIKKIIINIHNTLARSEISLGAFFKAAVNFSQPAQIQLVEELVPLQNDDVGKYGLIGAVLSKEVPTDIHVLELLNHLFAGIKNILPKLAGDADIENILSRKITSPEEKALLEPFFVWVSETLPKIESKSSRAFLIRNILERNINSPEERLLYKPLYELAFRELLSLEESDRVIAIYSMVNNPMSQEKISLLKPLFDVVIKALLTLKADFAKLIAKTLQSKKSETGDLLTAEEWQKIEQFAR